MMKIKSNVIQLIYDALNKNENEGLKFIEYLLKIYKILLKYMFMIFF